MSICGLIILVLSVLCTIEPSQQMLEELKDLTHHIKDDIISSDPNDIGFYLYPSESNPEDCDELTFMDIDSVKNSRFNSSNSVIFLIHGFIQNYTSEFPVNVRDAYLETGFAKNSNIIAVDWGKLSTPKDQSLIVIIQDLANLPIYILAAENVPIVGRRVADFIIFLMEIKMLSGPDKVHLVGQSLGAHCSGMAGLYFRQNTSNSLARITGTDPALQLFQGMPKSRRLDPSDALNVQIIHANQGEFGYVGDLGKVDFYFNGHLPIQVQPGCQFFDPKNVFCSHNMAPKYFAETIRTNTIMGYRCKYPFVPDCINKEYVICGEYCPDTVTGTYDVDLILSDTKRDEL